MADKHLKMKKRSREEHNLNNRIEDEPSFKKMHLNLTHSSNDSNSPPPPPPPTEATGSGVFDFPWMIQGSMKTDMKFEEEEEVDAFASSINTTSVSEIFGDEDRLILTTDKTTEDKAVSRRKVDEKDVVNVDGDDDDDGLECFWDSLLNQQPISNIEFAAGGLF